VKGPGRGEVSAFGVEVEAERGVQEQGHVCSVEREAEEADGGYCEDRPPWRSGRAAWPLEKAAIRSQPEHTGERHRDDPEGGAEEPCRSEASGPG
jgi:hypothetical protein